jgi:hypothetical protein
MLLRDGRNEAGIGAAPARTRAVPPFPIDAASLPVPVYPALNPDPYD